VRLPARAVAGQLAERDAALLDDQAGLALLRDRVASMTVSSVSPGDNVTARWCGASQAAIRPGPSHELVNRAWIRPPSRRSPSTSATQRANRAGSVSADHRSSMSVS
jgi:hypothetical protein